MILPVMQLRFEKIRVSAASIDLFTSLLTVKPSYFSSMSESRNRTSPPSHCEACHSVAQNLRQVQLWSLLQIMELPYLIIE